MNKYVNDLEKEMLTSDILLADETYISNGIFLLTKKYLNTDLLKKYTYNADELKEAIKQIPYEKGEEIDLTSVGTLCEMLPNGVLGIITDEEHYIDYDFIKILKSSYSWRLSYFTQVRNKEIIKFWGINDEFLGCVCAIKKDKEKEQ